MPRRRRHGARRAASDFSLVILPDQGENAIYNFVNSATSSVDVTIYELKDTTLVNDLVAREKAGVNVRVILDQAQKSYNTAAYNALTAGGVGRHLLLHRVHLHPPEDDHRQQRRVLHQHRQLRHHLLRHLP